ncbi:aldehyde dehydrogenase family protein [Klebsiella pneumoniae]
MVPAAISALTGSTAGAKPNPSACATSPPSDANLPFGGMKQSGTGRDFGPDWLDGWCETKSVCVRY